MSDTQGASSSQDKVIKVHSITSRWQLQPETADLFDVEIAPNAVFCSYFEPSHSAMEVKLLIPDSDGNFDGSIGSSVAHGDPAQPQLGGYSDFIRNVPDEAKTYRYKIYTLQERGKAQPYTFRVELFPDENTAYQARVADIAAKRAK